MKVLVMLRKEHNEKHKLNDSFVASETYDCDIYFCIFHLSQSIPNNK